MRATSHGRTSDRIAIDSVIPQEETLHAATPHDESPPSQAAELEHIFQRYHGQVFATAYRITGSAADAEDVLQTVFLRLLRRRDAVDLSPGPASYLHRAAVNASLDLLRSRARKRPLPLDEIELPARPGDDPDRRQRDREIRRCLRQAIIGLSPKSAEVFSLRFLEGMPNREIAGLTRSSQTAIGVMLHRARQRVKKDFASCIGGLDHV
ncbi:MAG: sigma-70 family RNA polymerase sigma factor [Acidobacteria bacterium]|nr:MAG: sigma-70 family RNA polymerase sigma factor [Acidobacteriota bacterium]